jgi:hypothetical protein
VDPVHDVAEWIDLLVMDGARAAWWAKKLSRVAWTNTTGGFTVDILMGQRTLEFNLSTTKIADFALKVKSGNEGSYFRLRYHNPSL